MTSELGDQDEMKGYYQISDQNHLKLCEQKVQNNRQKVKNNFYSLT